MIEGKYRLVLFKQEAYTSKESRFVLQALGEGNPHKDKILASKVAKKLSGLAKKVVIEGLRVEEALHMTTIPTPIYKPPNPMVDMPCEVHDMIEFFHHYQQERWKKTRGESNKAAERYPKKK